MQVAGKVATGVNLNNAEPGRFPAPRGQGGDDRRPARLEGAGASSGSISPSRRQPTAASQVRGATTGRRGTAVGAILVQPSNHVAEERGSSPRTPRKCFLQFCRT